MIRSFLIIVIGFTFVFTACNSNNENRQVNKTTKEQITSVDSNKTVTNNAKDKEPTAEKREIDNNETDTLSIADRRIVNGKYQSHISLEFAQTTLQINDNSQIKIVDSVCAVSVIPDTVWINKRQKEMGDSWIEVVSDNEYYHSLATDTLEKLNIPTSFAPREKRYITFIKNDDSNFTIDLTKMKDAWGLILFNGTDNPVYLSSTDIDDEIKEIYKR